MVNDPVRRAEVDVPQQVQFQTKPQIALEQIRQAVEDGVLPGVVLADEVYGSSREFRDGVAELKLDYSLAVRSTTTVWRWNDSRCRRSLGGEGAATQTGATGPDAPTDFGGAVGAGVAGERLARGGLARGQ